MEDVYNKVKAKSKFFKMLEQYNMSGDPTTATMSGANPGTLPVVPQAGMATGGVDPKVIAAQKKEQQNLLKAQADAAKAELTNLQKVAKDIPSQQKAVADRIKALQTTIKNAGKMDAASPL